MARPTISAAIKHLDRHGALLVFPLKNRKEPNSLWHCFYPRTEMRWEWTDDADDGVVRMWHLRGELSECGDVAYAKWFQGRATFFSLPLFTAILSKRASLPDPLTGLSSEARTIMEVLAEDSPLPTRRLRESVELSGKENEPAFTKAMKELWNRLLIVGHGEEEEGGFPSLCVGASKSIFEELWDEAAGMRAVEAMKEIDSKLPTGSPFRKWFDRTTALP